MIDFDKIIEACERRQKILLKLAEVRTQKIQERRKQAQNHPLTKARKSRAMKKRWAEKRERKRELELREKLGAIECTCRIRPELAPCEYCITSNYCEECDVLTHDDICPSCGRNIEREK